MPGQAFDPHPDLWIYVKPEGQSRSTGTKPVSISLGDYEMIVKGIQCYSIMEVMKMTRMIKILFVTGLSQCT